MKSNYVENVNSIVQKQWATAKDISVLLDCGMTSARRIRKELEEEILKRGKRIPPNKQVPMSLVIELYDIDITKFK